MRELPLPTLAFDDLAMPDARGAWRSLLRRSPSNPPQRARLAAVSARDESEVRKAQRRGRATFANEIEWRFEPLTIPGHLRPRSRDG